MGNENEFRFWVESNQAENCTILLTERESLYNDLRNNIKNAKNGDDRASIWWNKLFRGTIKDDQGQIHYLCSMDMSHVFSSTKTPSLCGVLLSKYREQLFDISGTDLRIIILKYDKNELPSNKENEFYGPYDDKLATNQYGMLTKQFGDIHCQERLLKWVRDAVLRLKDNLSTGYNLIVYGAPGTGKSYWVNHYNEEDRQEEKIQGMEINSHNITRVVFHPEYTYFDFVGSYRPKPKNYPSKDANNECAPYITYEFVPGPFTKVLVNALKDSDNMYTLLIEELNRADAAAVFGEVFQLLDRKDGVSEYPIEPSEEWLNYFEDALKDCEEGEKIINDIKENGVHIPSNMNIIATMNSADQGVHLLDTAFKRRWRYKYISVEKAMKDADNAAGYKEVKIKYANNNEVFWLEFIKDINNKLKAFNISEDRWIGPYFATEQELENDGGSAAVEKVLFYLWDDVLRDLEKRNNFFKKPIPKSLGGVIDNKKYQSQSVIEGLNYSNNSGNSKPDDHKDKGESI